MRTLIISDVHANLTALNAVLDDAEPFGQVWCLGDLVGYGPDPNDCIERVAALPGLRCVKGNHDAAILGDISINSFNYEARASLLWLESHLTPENKRWLQTLEERLEFDDITFAHGSPREPVWEYILDLEAAKENMSEFSTQICLVGHTHFPCVYQMTNDSIQSTRLDLHGPGQNFSLTHKSIVNPGSIGQPRDHDPRASYLLYDDVEESWAFWRVEYDIGQVQERILSAGLPQRHASRLAVGR